MAFNLSSSAITKLPMFPAPTTAKERKTISSFVSGRESSRDGKRRKPVVDPAVTRVTFITVHSLLRLRLPDPLNESPGQFDW